MDKTKRIKELVELLNKASYAYYNEDREIMSNYEYDKLFDELIMLEKETNVILDNSPTQIVSGQLSKGFKKVEHKNPALSLDKTKDISVLKEWLGNKKGILTWKLDGLTLVMTYLNGKLKSVVTRGNGYIGEDVTRNAKYFKGIPKTIPYKGELIVRGEAIMSYSEFERINEEIEDISERYKNARNLASGTVRALDEKIVKNREINVYSFQLVKMEVIPFDYNGDYNSFNDRLNYLKQLGFLTVEKQLVTSEKLESVIYDKWERNIIDNDFPSDGLVIEYDDIAYGESLGNTGHHPRYGMAFKWKDEVVETVLRKIEWSASMSGLLNPVAIFDTVEIEGTEVSRASVHNVSIAESLQLGIESKIGVYKANMIIPQIAVNFEPKGTVPIPNKCPICGANTKIETSKDGIKTLWCTSDLCPAKHIGKFKRFAERDAMNIDGLSTKTIEKFINKGFLKTFRDIYHLTEHKEEIITMDGFGEKSYHNLIESIEKSKNVTFEAFLYAIGIPLVGIDICKLLGKTFGGTSLDKYNVFVRKLKNTETFQNIEGIGPIIDKSIFNWNSNEVLTNEFYEVVDEINFIGESLAIQNSFISGKTFVITGEVHSFRNRNELKKFIEEHNGKVAGSVSSKTNYLINNDVSSNSSKNQKAKQLNIPIISEKEFLELI